MDGFDSESVTLEYMGDLPHETQSLCPECKRLLPAVVYAKGDGIVYIKRTCPEHGEFDEIYWEDVGYYNVGKEYGTRGKPTLKPNVSELGNVGINCPMDCGLCARHKSHTALANLVATNRCDLACWYCFFFAKKDDPIYEPSLQQVREMVKNLRAERPVPCNALQITGGEPTLRDDLVEIVRIAKEEGIDHVQVNTDGINFAFKPDLVRDLRAAGTNTVYMSFDGLSEKTNPKNHWEAPYAIENCRKAGMGIVLVPTVIGGYNDQELGNIVNFALNNLGIIRGVNFQPVSLVGRMPKKERNKQRVTIPRVLKNLEEQSGGKIAMEDFYVVPSITSITKFVEAYTGRPQYDLTTHFACGAATYLYKDGNRVIPITRFVDFDGLSEFLIEKAEELKKMRVKRLLKPIRGLKVLSGMNQFIIEGKKPKDFNIGRMLIKALIKHDYRSLGAIHHKLLFVGMMHFMDPYNYDRERVERCCIHYTMPDGRIVPFCAFNVIPEIYRDKVQAQYSIPAEDWENKTGKKLKDDKYKRDVERLTQGEIYKKTYGSLHNYFK